MPIMGLQCRQLGFERCLPEGGRATILANLDAVFETGRINLVIGENGAGKSTLLHLLAALLRPTSGEVLADGEPVSRFLANHRDLWRRKVGIVFQHLHLVVSMTVLENILLPLVPDWQRWPALKLHVLELIASLGLDRLQGQPVTHLSGGQRQRVAAARALAGRPRCLLLDEPTAFQDDAHALRLLALWRAAARQGCCVVLCSHDPRLNASEDIGARFLLLDGHLEQAS